MTRIVILFFVVGFGLGGCVDAFALEKDYQMPWCAEHGGQAEVVLPDKTRIDCLTDEYAIEFDFGHKWAESLGQALHYAAETDKTPGIVLIVDEQGYRYVERLQNTISKWRLPVRLWLVPK